MENIFREAMDVDDKVEEDMEDHVSGRLLITWGTID